MKSAKKKSNLKKLHTKLRKLVSEYIRRRDRGICCTCNARVWNADLGENDWKAMNTGHYRHGRLDYDETNLHCQCPRCNKWLSGNLGKYTLYLITKYGETFVRDLDLRADRETGGRKYTEEELMQLIAQYETKL